MVTYAKISPKMVNPRDIAGERKKKKKKKILLQMLFWICKMILVSYKEDKERKNW